MEAIRTVFRRELPLPFVPKCVSRQILWTLFLLIHLRRCRGKTAVTGTNTMYEKAGIGLAKAGEIYVASFQQNMDLQGENI